MAWFFSKSTQSIPTQLPTGVPVQQDALAYGAQLNRALKAELAKIDKQTLRDTTQQLGLNSEDPAKNQFIARIIRNHTQAEQCLFDLSGILKAADAKITVNLEKHIIPNNVRASGYVVALNNLPPELQMSLHTDGAQGKIMFTTGTEQTKLEQVEAIKDIISTYAAKISRSAPTVAAPLMPNLVTTAPPAAQSGKPDPRVLTMVGPELAVTANEEISPEFTVAKSQLPVFLESIASLFDIKCSVSDPKDIKLCSPVTGRETNCTSITVASQMPPNRPEKIWAIEGVILPLLKQIGADQPKPSPLSDSVKKNHQNSFTFIVPNDKLANFLQLVEMRHDLIVSQRDEYKTIIDTNLAEVNTIKNAVNDVTGMACNVQFNGLNRCNITFSAAKDAILLKMKSQMLASGAIKEDQYDLERDTTGWNLTVPMSSKCATTPIADTIVKALKESLGAGLHR